MMIAEGSAATAESSRAMGDLLALSILPALWQGLEPRALAESVADVIWSSLELDFVYLRLKLDEAAPWSEITRFSSEAMSLELSATLAEQLGREEDDPPEVTSGEAVRGLRVADWPIEWRGGRMLIAVARAAESFPAPHERLILSVIANHAKTAFQHSVTTAPAQQARRVSAKQTDPRVDASRRGGLAPWQVKRVAAFLSERLDQEVGLDELARVVNLSRFHFCKAFRRATGYSPLEWVTAQRMLRARELLTESNASITEVALAVGYKTPSAFTAVFRRTVGMTPSDYRRQQ